MMGQANAWVPSDLPRLQMRRTVLASVGDVGNHGVLCPPRRQGPCSDVLFTLAWKVLTVSFVHFHFALGFGLACGQL